MAEVKGRKQKKTLIVDWHGCYDSAWTGGYISPFSMAHPAKFSRALVLRIYQHMLEQGWIQKGQTCFDPFGGCGCGAVVAASLGLKWIGVELEPRFYRMAVGYDCEGFNEEVYDDLCPECQSKIKREQFDQDDCDVHCDPFNLSAPHHFTGNFELHKRTWEQMNDPLPVMINGDSRKAASLVRQHFEATVTSPPFDAQMNAGGSGTTDFYRKWCEENGRDPNAPNAQTQNASNQWGQNDANLGNMKSGDFDAAITSPPFLGARSGTEASVETSSGGPCAERINSVAQGNKLGQTSGQLSDMQEGELSAVVASPPYSGGTDTDGRGEKILVDASSRHRHKTRLIEGSAKEYGGSSGQLGAMPEGSLADAALSSPPYADSVGTPSLGSVNKDDWGKDGRDITARRSLSGKYGNTSGQLGEMREGEMYSSDESQNLGGILYILLWYTNDCEPFILQLPVTLDVLQSLALSSVPIFSVNFNDRIAVGKKKVTKHFSDFVFVNITNASASHDFSNSVLKIAPATSPIAYDRTELAAMIFEAMWLNSKLLAASEASLGYFRDSASDSAFWRTIATDAAHDGVALNGKSISAQITSTTDLPADVFVKALLGAKFASAAFGITTIGLEEFSAGEAFPIHPLSLKNTSARSRAAAVKAFRNLAWLGIESDTASFTYSIRLGSVECVTTNSRAKVTLGGTKFSLEGNTAVTTNVHLHDDDSTQKHVGREDGCNNQNVDGVASSPPYEQSADAQRTCMENGTRARQATSERGTFAEKYGGADGNIGAESGETFWSAARTILEQTYLLLKPGGYAAWVLKSYVKAGKIVDFPDNWRRLCEAVGFETVQIARAWLVKEKTEQQLFGEPITTKKSRKSFFRRLYENKNPHNSIDFEVVLFVRKPMEKKHAH